MPSLTPNDSTPQPAKTKPRKTSYTPESREKSVVFWIAFFAIFVSCLPYWLGFAIAPAGKRFGGYPYNIDDHWVYLSWIHQTQTGHFFIRNLFTTDPQPILLFNLFFSVVGLIARIPGLSTWGANEIARIAGAIGLLYLIYRFYRYCLPQDRTARITAFALACLSSGFGWVQWAQWSDKNPSWAPIDAFQPEAYTFTSLYLFSLFVVSTSLILGTLFAMVKCARTGLTRYAVLAGCCAFILGDIHSYDIFHVSAAWGLFLIVLTTVRKGRGVGKLWLQSILALAMSMPTVLYTFYVYKHNPVFTARADSDTLSPKFWRYIPGYGVELLLAAAAAVLLALWLKNRRQVPSNDGETPAANTGTPPLWNDRLTPLFVACWAVAGLAVIYVPFAFQRKTLMGEHIPLCLLAGWGAAMLTSRLKPAARVALLSLLVAVSLPSNALFLLRDMNHLEHNQSETSESPFLSSGEWDAFQYIGSSTPSGAPIVTIPVLGLYIPGLTGHPVWAGHWSETPDYAKRIAAYQHFSENEPDATPDMQGELDGERKAFLQSTRAAYLLYPTTVDALAYTDGAGRLHTYRDFAASPPSYLVPVYRNKELTLFRIDVSK